ncbi:MAG: agmatinase, partial [Deltaproteobacteria bacterium]|nr:agmatinase [Deltaproteobacteria bacterium]
MRYQPEDSSKIPRFCGVRTFMRLPAIKDLDNADFAIVGAPFDTGATFRVGARFGPEAIRSASVLLRSCDPERGINLFDRLSGVDYGDLTVVPGFIEDSFEKIEDSFAPVVASGVVPICLGGDHSVSLPLLRAVAKKHGPVALLHLDSHSDTWDEHFGHSLGHGTPFLRAVEEGLIDPARTVQLGMRGGVYSTKDRELPKSLGFEVIPTRQMLRSAPEEIAARVRQRIGSGAVYLTFDIDVLDPAFAPGTGTPEIGGPSTFQVIEILRGLTGIEFVGFDLVEVLPAFDHAQI